MGVQTIYPENFAKMLLERAGQKYQPSNGTEGECFFDAWCRQCARDRSMREGDNVDDCDDNERCDIIANTMACSPEDEEYPKEWTYDKNGQPCCTAFVPAGQPIPAPRDVYTIDMFDCESGR
ncbi:hypothetical protein [Cupriavidus pinatubonensis]|uniref:Uncharacterized protein n=1 Tax=Cupriavidus pinatubonensis TaxID=248026 RepID=A0ABN7Y938_9BURK|nr:hypothetical protein [Cupriavidus pinatubonensis]CAG9169903.1 hypothetical protein LMG23994_01721 [Cupriavidus pinatubonensis]